MLKFNLNIRASFIFFSFLVILLLQHVWIFCTVNIDCIDDDQMIMWYGAKEYSKGMFHEPRFYGQAYNTFLEALLAVPLIWIKVPVYYAVPAMTHLLFLCPFIYTSVYLYKHKQAEKAIMVLALLLFMPLGFDVMTSIPRGFVTGVFFSLFFVVNLLNPKNYKFIYINTLFSIIGFLVNPNSVLISAPFLFYLFLINYKDKTYYKYSVFALLSGIPFELLLNQFYRSHPDHIVYTFDNAISSSYFFEAIRHINDHFAHIGLFIENTAIITLLCFLLIGIYFFVKNKKWFMAYILFITIILFSLFNQKVSHGGVWPFFSLSRMFIGIPYFYMCSIILMKGSFVKLKETLLVTVLLFTVYKGYTYNEKLSFYKKEENFLDVGICSLDDIKNMSNGHKQLCERYNTNQIVILGWTWRDNIIHYAGPALDDNYPKVFKPHFERRRWVTDEEFKTTHKSFIVYTRHRNLDTLCWTKYKDVHIQKIDDWGNFYIYDNDKNSIEFLRYIHAETLGF